MSEQFNIRLNYTHPQPTVLTYEKPAGTPVNLTTHTATMRIISLDDTDLNIVSPTSANGGLTLGGALGTITINWQATLSGGSSTLVNATPEVGSYRLYVTNASGINDFVTSGTIVVEDRP